MFSWGFRVTPSTLNVSTLSDPGIICLLEGRSTDFLRPMTIISLVRSMRSNADLEDRGIGWEVGWERGKRRISGRSMRGKESRRVGYI